MHIDFAELLDGFTLLVVVDPHTKWIEVVPIKTTSATIEVLRTVFSRFRVPETVVSCNCPQFPGKEFGMFTRLNNIVRLRMAPCHCQSNGLAKILHSY